MGHFTLVDFLMLSIPEELLMAFMAWTLLGKRGTIKFLNVIMAGLIIAVSFAAIKDVMFLNSQYVALIQVLALIIIIYFIYKLNYLEAIVGALLTIVIFSVIQYAVAIVGYFITGYKFDIFTADTLSKFLIVTAEIAAVAPFAFVAYKKKIKILNFKKREVNKLLSKKIRYLVLQLTFTFLIIIVNANLYFRNLKNIAEMADKLLLGLNFAIIVIFTILVVNSAYKMGESIQREEELKRKLDGMEIMQNIDFLCKLIDTKEYDEVKTILKSMKTDVDKGMINSNSTDRG